MQSTYVSMHFHESSLSAGAHKYVLCMSAISQRDNKVKEEYNIEIYVYICKLNTDYIYILYI